MTKQRQRLLNAYKAKNNEFYTPYDVVESEMSQISSFFEDKFVYNNCDDGARSNFYKWFKDNFKTLKLKKLVATGYDENGIGHKYEYDGANEIITDNVGDFAQNAELLKECDVVCTNPPFSLYTAFTKLLINNCKKFVVVGSCLKMHYFKHLLISNQLNFGHIDKPCFIISSSDGSKMQQCNWFSNVMSEKKPKMRKFTAKYADIPHIFFKGKYDNEKVLFIKKTKEVPIDYYGYIAIPLSFIVYDMSDFDFYAVMTSSDVTKMKLYPLEDGTWPFARVLVKRKQAKMNNDPYDDLPLGMIDEEFFEEIALKQREPTVDEIRDMWILSAQEHPELFGETFFKKELSTLEALSTHIAERSLYTNSKHCDIIEIDKQNT